MTAKPLFSYKKFWAHRLGVAPFLPMSLEEMAVLGWDACDVILVTGDAYIDHPSFGAALIGRLLEAQGFRVGIISQPDWTSARDFRKLGAPTLFFGVTAGNMDSMVNHYTAQHKIRSDDAYTPHGAPGKRPDRAATVYGQRCREAFSGVPVVLGSIEASLRRVAHYDYWSDKVRRSILFDSKADILLFGNAERSVVDLAHRLAKGEKIGCIRDLRGSAFLTPKDWLPDESWQVEDVLPLPQIPLKHGALVEKNTFPMVQQRRVRDRQKTVLRLPSYENVREQKENYAIASRALHLESSPFNGRALMQAHGERQVFINPPPFPLESDEFDAVYELPYARSPHPVYGAAKIPAWEMIRFSINIMRGCFGGCTFCSITAHEGRIVQSRSTDSVLREIESLRDKTKGFSGVVSDLGGPTANMYQMRCRTPAIEAACRRLSCVYPAICPEMETSHRQLIELYQRARALPGIKKVLIGSGLRYDLAIRDPAYIRELATHHVGGYLKIAPEHTESAPLQKMMKPGIESYERFRQLFDQFSKAAGKEQYLVPYFIAAHPGTTDEDMLNLALWLKKNAFRPDQVQIFLPTPMAIATAMYYSLRDPLKKMAAGEVFVVRHGGGKKLHKAFLRYHDPANWHLLREALKKMGRGDLIGNTKKHLVPWSPPQKSTAPFHRSRKPS